MNNVTKEKPHYRLRRGYALEDVVAGTCRRIDGQWQLLLVFLQNGLEGKTREVETPLRKEAREHVPPLSWHIRA